MVPTIAMVTWLPWNLLTQQKDKTNFYKVELYSVKVRDREGMGKGMGGGKGGESYGGRGRAKGEVSDR